MRRDGCENAPVHRLISAVARRRWWQHFAISTLAAAGIVVVAALLSRAGGSMPFPEWLLGVLGILLVGAAMAWSRKLRTHRAAAEAIERSRPSCRNLVITAEEMARHPDRYTTPLIDRVVTHANAATEGLRARSVVPAGRTAAALVASLGLSLLAVPAARVPVREAVAQITGSLPPALTGARSVRVTIEPPSYTGSNPSVLTDPARIDALEGSRIRFDVPAGWRVRFGTTAITSDVIPRDSGYFAIESPSADDRRLIPLNVVRDRAPSVRINTPAKDLLLPDGSKTIPVQLSAADDLALVSIELRFTKVSGTGEQFEFVEGTVPVTVQRSSDREWTADARLALASMRLGPGDSLVYRAVARDGRPGDAGLGASDTYFIEIAGPGQVPLEGVEMPSEMERYAMSQQMIVVKLERLRKQEASLTRTAIVEEAASIAAEQRTVRANFIFLLGGHVEDEEEEAAQSHEIQEGRLENTARKDINAAISQMTRVEQGLAALEIPSALPPARAAVESLQRAFGRSRYLLRALAVRSRLDPSRRLSGDLDGAADWRRIAHDPEVREGEQARRLLDALLDLAAETGPVPNPAFPLSQKDFGRSPETRSSRIGDRPRQQLAEAALAIDPAAALWQDVARQLLETKDVDGLNEVIAKVAQEAIRGSVPRTPMANGDSRIERAFRTERR